MKFVNFQLVALLINILKNQFNTLLWKFENELLQLYEMKKVSFRQLCIGRFGKEI